MPPLFPIALNLSQRTCVVVGGGSVAARRVRSLLEAGARVRVVAPDLDPSLVQLAADRSVELLRRPYCATDLAEAVLAVAATDDPAVNAAIVADSRDAGVICCDASSPARGDFVVPSIVRRGDLLIAVTASGTSPALAARLRDELAERYGPEYGELTSLLGEARERVLAQVPEPRERQRILRQLAEDESLLDLIRAGRQSQAREKALSCISLPQD